MYSAVRISPLSFVFLSVVDRHNDLRYDSRMITAVSSQTMSQIDSSAQRDYAIPGIVLMEQAGLRAWRQVSRTIESKDVAVVFVAGGGNNGGDALVMARQAFNDGWMNCRCILCGTHLSPSCITQRAICRNLGIETIDVASGSDGDGPMARAEQALASADLIVDGLSGTGLRGPLSGAAATLVALINQCADREIPVLSVDVPSGAGDDVPVTAPIVRACATISMGLPKLCCYHPVVRAYGGEITVVNPSFPARLLGQAPATVQLATFSDCSLTAMDSTRYKNTRGHVAVFGGSPGFTGAPRLAARGAFHARCGLVTLFADDEIYPVLAAENPSVIVRKLPMQTISGKTSIGLSVADLQDFQAILAGPGWGAERTDLLRVLLDSRLPLVLDADGIKAYAALVQQDPLVLKGHGPLLFTPHPGELRILVQAVLGQAAAQTIGRADTPALFLALLQELSKRTESIVLAKGHVNWIVDSTTSPSPRAVVVDSMTCELGVAGSGDVLAGICAALLSQKPVAPLGCAVDGALLHLRAGTLAKEKQGWFSSEELVEYVGLAVNSCAHSNRHDIGGTEQ